MNTPFCRRLLPHRCTVIVLIGVVLLLVGCAVLTVDVDVYKGRLINEEVVQMDQLAVMAMGAKPLLVALRDKAEFEFRSPKKVMQLRSNDWYRIGYCAPAPAPANRHSRFTNDLAIRVNLILSLYENRTPEFRRPWIVALRSHFEAFRSNLQVLRPDTNTLKEVHKEMKKRDIHTTNTNNPIQQAFLDFIAPTTRWRSDSNIFWVLASPAYANTSNTLSSHWTNKLEDPAGEGGANARFQLMRDTNFLWKCAEQVFPGPGAKARQEWLVGQTKSAAESFASARSNMVEIFRESIHFLQALEMDSTPAEKDGTLVHASQLVASVTRPKLLVAVLKAGGTNLPAAITQLQSELNSRLPQSVFANINSGTANFQSLHNDDTGKAVQRALSGFLRSDPQQASYLLLKAHDWLITIDEQECDRFFASIYAGTNNTNGLARNYRFRINRAYGLAAGPQPGDTPEALLEGISLSVDQLSLGDEDLARGRLDEGIQSLIDEYLKASSGDNLLLPPSSDVRRRREQLLRSLVGFAEKIKFIGDNEILLKKPRGPLDLRPVVHNLFFANPDTVSESYVMLLQSLGNSIISLVDELRYRERNPHPAADPSEAENRGKETAIPILSNAQKYAQQPTETQFQTNANVAIGTNSPSLAIAVNVTNSVSSLPNGLAMAAQLLSALDGDSSSLQSIDNLLTTLRNLRIAYIAAGRTNDSKNIEAAIIVSEDYRRNMLPLRPPISALRNASTVTSLQGGTSVGWRNMLERQAWRSVPVLPSFFAYGNHRAKIQRELDRQYWQNINQIRLAAAVKANYVVVKDDIGNWYVKGFSADPSSAIKAVGVAASTLNPPRAATQAVIAATNAARAKTPGTILQDQQTPFLSAYKEQTGNQWSSLETWVTNSLRGELSNKWSKSLPTTKVESLSQTGSVTNVGSITNAGSMTNGGSVVKVEGIVHCITNSPAGNTAFVTNIVTLTSIGSVTNVGSVTNFLSITNAESMTRFGNLTNVGSISAFGSFINVTITNGSIIISNSLNLTNVGTIKLAEALSVLTNSFTEYLKPAPKADAPADKIMERLEKLRQFRNELAKNLDNPPASNVVIAVVNAQSQSFLSNRVSTVGKLENALDVLYQSIQAK